MKDHIVARFPQGKKRAFTMSYDDGVTTDERLAQLMRAHGVRGTFNLISGRFAAQEQAYPKGNWGSLTARQCRNVAGSEMEIAVHTLNHLFLTKLPESEVMNEVCSDREALEQFTGGLVRGAAYPYGAYNDAVVQILRSAGICYARTTVSTERFGLPSDWLRLPATCHHNNPRLMELADEFFSPLGRYGDPKLFYLWGHSYEFERDDNWAVIEQFLDQIGGHDSDVWYATNIEIFDYMQAFDRLVWNIGQSVVQNPSATDVWISAYHIGCEAESSILRIPAGETVRL